MVSYRYTVSTCMYNAEKTCVILKELKPPSPQFKCGLLINSNMIDYYLISIGILNVQLREEI